MRIMALDVGDRRIGVALSDPLLLMASPLTAIVRRTLSADIDAILRLASENEIGDIVVGVPISLLGRKGPQAQTCLAFAKALSQQAPVPVHTHDERFSTFEAERRLRDAGAKPSRDKGRVDAAAAAVILQGYLDKRRR
ncbi:MAG: Holliday junction resolvase RuvX [SAR202 cluster bacterium]|nr:Holliday junction resolvase RuvX [SAR202 cluster bacterium]